MVAPRTIKVSSLLGYLLEMQDAFPSTKLLYHYFASYHGSSICDAVAAHAKNNALAHLDITQSSPKSAADLRKIVGELSNTTTVPIHSPLDSAAVYKTLKGIKKHHKMEFCPPVIKAFALSTDNTPPICRFPSK